MGFFTVLEVGSPRSRWLQGWMPVNTIFLACRWPPSKSIITGCYCSVSKSCPTLCDPMGWSMPDFPVLHLLPEFTQTHVHWVGDGPFNHHLSSPSPPALSLSQHQSVFQWVSSSHQVAKILELQLQNRPSNEYSALISFRIDWFDLFADQGTLKSLL